MAAKPLFSAACLLRSAWTDQTLLLSLLVLNSTVMLAKPDNVAVPSLDFRQFKYSSPFVCFMITRVNLDRLNNDADICVNGFVMLSHLFSQHHSVIT